MLKHTLTAITIGMILFFLYLFQYTGAFKTVQISEDQRGPYTVLYKKHLGAYHKIVANLIEVEAWAKANGFKCRYSFGEYFDDPRVVEEGRLNSRGGCLFDESMTEDKAQLEKMKSQLPKDFLIGEIPQTRAVVALFTGAPGIGPVKVYPKIQSYIVENNLKRKTSMIEIYEVLDKNNVQTIYVSPVTDK